MTRATPGTRHDGKRVPPPHDLDSKAGAPEQDIAAVVKVKSGLFAAPLALERVLLEAGREAQARVAREAPPL